MVFEGNLAFLILLVKLPSCEDVEKRYFLRRKNERALLRPQHLWEAVLVSPPPGRSWTYRVFIWTELFCLNPGEWFTWYARRKTSEKGVNEIVKGQPLCDVFDPSLMLLNQITKFKIKLQNTWGDFLRAGLNIEPGLHTWCNVGWSKASCPKKTCESERATWK